MTALFPMGFDYTNQLFSVDIQLCEPPITIPKGTSYFPFSYQLPKDLIPTYMCQRGSIIHSAEVVVHIKRGLTRKWEREYKVLAHNLEYPRHTIGVSEPLKSNEHLHVRLENDIVRSHAGFQIHFKVEERERTCKLRFDLVRCERTVTEYERGPLNTTTSYTEETSIMEKYYEIKPDDRGTWRKICFGENLIPELFTFKSKYIQVEYYLKVTLEVIREDDIFVTFPLRFPSFHPEIDILDKIEMELGETLGFDDEEGVNMNREGTHPK